MTRRRWFVVLLLLLTAQPLWAYIDPGTGSMLFSAISGIVVTAYFFLRNLLIRLKSLPGRLWGRKARSVETRRGLVIYGEGRQYANVFRPVLEELARRGLPALYYTSDPEDPLLSEPRPGVETRLLPRGHAAYLTLNVLEADVVLSTTPALDVFHWKRSPRVKTYAHVVHAPNDVTLYRLFGLDYYDVVLANGDFQEAGIRELEAQRGLPAKRFFTVGCGYLDVLRSRVDEVLESLPPREGLTVLVSPTWGPSGLLTVYGEALLEPLAQSGLSVIVRPHPQTKISETALLERLIARFPERPGWEWDFDRDNLRSMARADLMVSDFSGIIFDFAFLLGRPVLTARTELDLRPYDAYDLKGTTWTARSLPRIGQEIGREDLPGLGDRIRSLASDPAGLAQIALVRDEAWPHPGEAARRTVDVLERLMEEGDRHG